MTEIPTSLTRLLGIDVPILQAPMGFAASPEMVAAVSNAGGLGMLSVTWRDLDDTRHAVQHTRTLTDRPFAVNLGLEWPQQERLQICLDEGVPIVSLFWGDPAEYVEQIRDAGALLLQTVADAEEARRVSEGGADVIVAQGWEAGGHVWGTVATLPLVPRVVDVVAPKPVVAAGGIADGRGLAAALMLGAAGVWLGTRFLASAEAAIHPEYQAKILEATEADTVYSTVFDLDWPDAPHRTLRNDTIAAWESAGSPPTGHRPGEGETVAAWSDGTLIRRYETMFPFPDMTGAVGSLPLYAGQTAGLVTRVQPAAQIVHEIAQEAVTALTRGSQIVDS